MNTVKRMLAFLSDAAFVMLLGSALIVIVGFVLSPFTALYTWAWLATALALTMSVFIWLLPLTLVVLLLGARLDPTPERVPVRRDE